VDNPKLHAQWMDVKRGAKERLARYIKRELGITVNADSLFDVQVKRIHEYKRQLLNVLSVIHRYRWIKSLTPEQRRAVVPRTVIFGGKAAPGYYIAKLIIKLICSVGDVVNSDAEVGALLKVVFVPNYCVRWRRSSFRPRSCRSTSRRRAWRRRHQQHEVRHERRPHHRHARRRQHRDPRGDRQGEHVHLWRRAKDVPELRRQCARAGSGRTRASKRCSP